MKEIIVRQMPVGDFQSRTCIVACPVTGEAVEDGDLARPRLRGNTFLDDRKGNGRKGVHINGPIIELTLQAFAVRRLIGKSLQSRNHSYRGINRRRKVTGSWWQPKGSRLRQAWTCAPTQKKASVPRGRLRPMSPFPVEALKRPPDGAGEDLTVRVNSILGQFITDFILDR